MCLSFRGEEGEVHSKKELINTARQIAKESEDVIKMARKVADACTDKRMKRVSGNLGGREGGWVDREEEDG